MITIKSKIIMSKYQESERKLYILRAYSVIEILTTEYMVSDSHVNLIIVNIFTDRKQTVLKLKQKKL